MGFARRLESNPLAAWIATRKDRQQTDDKARLHKPYVDPLSDPWTSASAPHHFVLTVRLIWPVWAIHFVPFDTRRIGPTETALGSIPNEK